MVIPLLIAVGQFHATRADKAYVLNCDNNDVENALLIGIDTSIPANVSRVELPLSFCEFTGCVVNNGSNVFAAIGSYVVEVDSETDTLTRTYTLPGVSFADWLILDPENSSQMFVVDVGQSVWTLDLVTGTATMSIDTYAYAARLRPGTRELWVADVYNGLSSYNVDTGNIINSTVNPVDGNVLYMEFIDSDTLFMHGYGVGRYHINDSELTEECVSEVDGDMWGYDSMFASDGKRFVHSGLSESSFVRNVSDCTVIAADIPVADGFSSGSIAILAVVTIISVVTIPAVILGRYDLRVIVAIRVRLL